MDDEAPDALCCPIGKTLMVDPVMAADGHTYEYKNILQWLQTKNTSPMTNCALPNTSLTRSYTMKKVISYWQEKNRNGAGNPQQDQRTSWYCFRRNCEVRRDATYQICACSNCTKVGQERLKKNMEKATQLRAALEANAKELQELLREEETRSRKAAELLDGEKERVLQLQMALDNAERQSEMNHQRTQARIRQQQEEQERINKERELERKRKEEERIRRQQEEEEAEERRRREEERQRQARYWFENFVVEGDDELFCKICRIREHINNQGQMRRHVEGVRHDENVYRHRWSQDRNKFFCQTCDVVCSSAYSYMQHLMGSRHESQVQQGNYSDSD